LDIFNYNFGMVYIAMGFIIIFVDYSKIAGAMIFLLGFFILIFELKRLEKDIVLANSAPKEDKDGNR